MAEKTENYQNREHVLLDQKVYYISLKDYTDLGQCLVFSYIIVYEKYFEQIFTLSHQHNSKLFIFLPEMTIPLF